MTLLGACSDSDGNSPPPADAGPPPVYFSYGANYPGPQLQLNGVFTPTSVESFPTMWIAGRVFARTGPTGLMESLDGLVGTLVVTSVADGSVIAEATALMTAMFDDMSSHDIAWMEVSIELCSEPRTRAGASIRVDLTVTRDGMPFVSAGTGDQLIECWGDPDCLAVCGP